MVNRIDENIDCACKKFEHSEILCKHILRYLDKKQKTTIPTNFVKLRWTRNTLNGGFSRYYPPVLVEVGDLTMTRYSSLCKSFQSLIAIGSCSKPRYNYVMDLIEKGKSYGIENFWEEEDNSRTEESLHNYGEHDPIFNPLVSQIKGRPKAERYKSGVDASTSKINMRKCDACGLLGHDRRKCPKMPTEYLINLN
ncbi:protein FAR1-RELATED SEQUENCE 12-like [Apium graveolens]|uniref:protein FAR1-RELATED SEQUENCE 12-like n=1 Tax=Apium graveolens TaxID=4045 RepID=UPI003D7BC2BB